MKFATSVSTLQDVVSDLSKGVGNDKAIPLTSLVGIECLPDRKVQFTVTDYVNYLVITLDLSEAEDDEEYEEGFATVSADMFIKLVQKCNSGDVIAVETMEKCLGVSSGGTYKLEYADDGSGEPVHFMAPTLPAPTETYVLDTKTLYAMVGSCKQALLQDRSDVYSNYLLADKVIATDRTRAVFVESDVAKDKKHILLGSSFVDLLMLFRNDATIRVNTEGIVATSADGHTTIISKTDTDIGEFNEAGTTGMLGVKFPSTCKVSKSDLLGALNRIGLFCAKYEDNAIKIHFKEESMVLSSANSSAVEEIEYHEFMDTTDFSIWIDITRLQSHLKAYDGEKVDLWYGVKNCIKLEDTDVTQIIALVAR